MRRLLPLLLLAATAFAGDLTGKWAGTLEMKTPDGETRTSDAVMELKQSGDQITGQAGPNEQEMFPIENAKLDGKRLTFTVSHEGRMLKFELTLMADDKLEGSLQGESDSGEKRTGKLTFTKKA